MKRFSGLMAFVLFFVLSILSGNAQTYDLTTNDFYSWTSANANGAKQGNASCAYEINKSTGMPYGDGNVHYLNYADLSKASKLIIVASAGEPRALFNRIVDNGEVRVEVPRDAATYETVSNNSDGSKTYTIDVAKIVAKDGFAHLHAIKGANWQNTTVKSIKYVIPQAAPTTQQEEMPMNQFNPNIWETGKYTYNNGIGTFYAGQYGFGGWHSDSGYDVNKYKSITVNFSEAAINGTSFRLFKVNNYWTGENDIISTDCSGKTSVTVDIANISKLYYIGFWNYGNANGNYQSCIKIKSVVLNPKDNQQEVTTPTEPEVTPTTPTEPEETVTPEEPEETPTTPEEPEEEEQPEIPSYSDFNYIPSDPVVAGSSTNANVKEEFYTLTANDFGHWTAATASATKVNNAACTYDLNKSTGMVYGDVNVNYLNYVDLSGAYKLYVDATEGEPRVLFNRIVDNGTVNVEVPRDNTEYETVIDNGNGSKTYVIDIAKIVENEGFAHLHAIKGANWQNTKVTSIKYSVNKAASNSLQPMTLSFGEFNPSIWETGKLTVSNGVATFYAGQYGFGGWHYDGGLDVSNYKSAVVTFEEPAISGTSFRLFKVNNYWTGDANIISTDCSGKTSVTVDINNIDELYYIGFWNYGNANGNYKSYIKIKSVSFIPKEGASATVETKEYALGDVNGDGKVNTADKNMLLDILDGYEESNPRADINDDCIISDEDVDALKAILAGNYQPTYNWVGTWTTALQLVEESNLPPSPGLSGNSIRQIVQVSTGGKKVRLKFSNEFGKSATQIQSVEIAIAKTAGSSSAIKEETTKTLTFNGNKGVTIQAGKMVVSDPISFALPARANVAITIHYGTCSNTVITGHPGSRTTSYIATGNTSNFSSAVRTDHWYNICGIDIVGNKMSRAVAVLGNSITDGRGSTTNNQDRWTDNFSRSLLANADTRYVSVLNLGIGGNCVLGGGLGPTAKSRYDRDILQQAGVKYAIIFIGVNDLGYAADGKATADGLIAEYKTMISKARALGLKVYGATITPFKNGGYYTADHELGRSLVNNWIRTSGEFDAVIDFDKIVRDPSDKEALNSAFLFQNDWLHPNAAGYKLMGESVDINLFKLIETRKAE